MALEKLSVFHTLSAGPFYIPRGRYGHPVSDHVPRGRVMSEIFQVHDIDTSRMRVSLQLYFFLLSSNYDPGNDHAQSSLFSGWIDHRLVEACPRNLQYCGMDQFLTARLKNIKNIEPTD